MAGVNKATILGRVGRDPEYKRTPSGQSVVNFSMATSEKYKDKQGNQQESTEWHNIVMWGKLADLVNQYVKKGSQLYLEGKITTRSWEGQDGQKKYKTEIVGHSMQFLGSPQESNGGQQNGGGYQAPQSDPGPDQSQAPYNDGSELPF